MEIAIQGLSTLILPLSQDHQIITKVENRPDLGVFQKLKATKLTAEAVRSAFQKTHLQYDRQGDEHYNLISALHKSIRGGYESTLCMDFIYTLHAQGQSFNKEIIVLSRDADAGLYWLGRMLVAGEEPLYIARRLIRLASEDIGLADASALPLV